MKKVKNIEWDITEEELRDVVNTITPELAAKVPELTEEMLKDTEMAVDYLRRRPGAMYKLFNLPSSVDIHWDECDDDVIVNWLADEYGFFINGCSIVDEGYNNDIKLILKECLEKRDYKPTDEELDELLDIYEDCQSWVGDEMRTGRTYEEVEDYIVHSRTVDEIIKPKGVTKTWKVYGRDGHRQKRSFEASVKWNWSDDDCGIRIFEAINADKTGTNEYTIIKITRNTARECYDELDGQLTDGYFENACYGDVIEVKEENV